MKEDQMMNTGRFISFSSLISLWRFDVHRLSAFTAILIFSTAILVPILPANGFPTAVHTEITSKSLGSFQKPDTLKHIHEGNEWSDSFLKKHTPLPNQFGSVIVS
jgi:hypothetical protein